MLSKRARYAIKTLIYIYKNEESNHVTAKSISENENIPYKFLEKILRELRQHKIIKSKHGAVGGYRFFQPPTTVKVMDIMRIIEKASI